MEKMKEILMEKLCEELHDSEEYLQLSKDAEKHEQYALAKGLELVALDEATHADFIRDSLIGKGFYRPEDHKEIEEKYHAAISVFGIQK